MRRDELPPIEASRENVHELLLAIVSVALVFTLASLATSSCLAALGDLFTR